MINSSVILVLLSIVLIGQVSSQTMNMNCQCQLPYSARGAVSRKRRTNVLAASKAAGDRAVTIYWAGDGHGELFVNGESLGVCGWQIACNKDITLKHGDVISVNATDNTGAGPYGVLVGVFDGNDPLALTGSTGWVAINQNDLDTGVEDWKKPGYDACHWPAAGSGTTAPATNGFPPGTDAVYVWAKGSDGTDTVLVRFRVGGETCCVCDSNPTGCPDGVCGNCLRLSGNGYSQKDCYAGWTRSACYSANTADTSDYTWCGASP